MLIPTIVHAMLQDRRKRIETQRTARESLEQKAKQEYDSTKERLEKEIPIHKDIDLVNYCAMENINPTAIILEELELSANSPILNKPIETAFDYARSLGPED
jgi:hypothetical protein